MAYIAHTGERLNAVQLSRITGYSRNHIAKVLSVLVKARMLTSGRGPNGGFDLARPAEEISLLEIYEAVEGKVENDQCDEPCELCSVAGCITGGLGARFNEEFLAYLRNKKLSDYQTDHKRISPITY